MPKTTAFDVSARYVEKRIDIPKATASQSSTFAECAGFVVEELQVLFPAGHVALTGFRFLLQGVAIVPWNQATTFLIGDKERRDFEMNIQCNVAPTIVCKNSDNSAHTLWFVAKLRDIQLRSDVPQGIQTPNLPIVIG